MHLAYDADTDECLGQANQNQIWNSNVSEENYRHGICWSNIFKRYIYTMEFMNIEQIVGVAAVRFNVDPRDLTGPYRPKSIINYRFATIWVCHQKGFSYPEIGRAFGQKDHTSALNANRRVNGDVRLMQMARGLLDEVDRTVERKGFVGGECIYRETGMRMTYREVIMAGGRLS